jgi:hypothetical protein
MRRVQALALAAPTRTRTVVRLAIVGAIVLVGLLASPPTIAAASLFRTSQTDTMRVYVSIPQVFAPSIGTQVLTEGQRVSVPTAARGVARGGDTVQPAIPSPRANSRPKTGRDSS